jgi:hypothetical protein
MTVTHLGIAWVLKFYKCEPWRISGNPNISEEVTGIEEVEWGGGCSGCVGN